MAHPHQQLPSYEEATARLDWLHLVAPYVSFSDYHALCLVSQHFWPVFAPWLWRNPLWSVREAGLNPGDDIAWWLEFVFRKLTHVRRATRALVQVLDVRGFARAAYHFASDDHTTLQRSVEMALALLPNVDSILLDGHADIDPYPLFRNQLNSDGGGHRPLILSVAGCPVKLPNAFFASVELCNIVYLDLSGLRGSLAALTTLPPQLASSPLPELRVLKLRDRELDDTQILSLVSHFKLRLWSLDLCGNKITDLAMGFLASAGFPVRSLRTDAHFEVEGKIVLVPGGTPEHGRFYLIEESRWSGDFSHPDRYLADAPEYSVHAHGEPQEYELVRSDGCRPTLHDSADAAMAILCGRGHGHAAQRFRTSHGLSHLKLSHNKVTSLGLSMLMQNSNGQLEHVVCDSMPLFSFPKGPPQTWPRSAKLYGCIGGAHVFRPVLSSNLRILRIHHSLVTRIPMLEAEGLSKLSRTFLSEKAILPRVEQLYAHPFVPDANPRLYSLTLTCIPRQSSGPLTVALIRFLEQLSLQECAIQEAKRMAPSRRGPKILQGLRHLRLEFESDDGFSTSSDLDAATLMDSGDQGFSFFEDEQSSKSNIKSSPGSSQAVATKNPILDVDSVDGEAPRAGAVSGRSKMDRDNQEYVTYHGEWNGEKFSVPVWIGPGPQTSSSSPSSAAAPAAPAVAAPRQRHNSLMDDYRSLAIDHGLGVGVGPATPSQIAAGAPKGSYLFHTAWCAAVMPRRLEPPASAEVAAMRDVLQELKEYRAAGRAKYEALRERDGPHPTPLGAPHYYWTGRLEVSTGYVSPSS